MTTKTTNHGVGDGSGRWLFEDFVLQDGRRGRFVVEFRPVWIDMKNEPTWPTRWSFEVESVFVVWGESTFFSQDGDSRRRLESQVIEAFQNDIDEVEVCERDHR